MPVSVKHKMVTRRDSSSTSSSRSETERSSPFGQPRHPDLVLSTGLACAGLGGISRSHTPRTMVRMAGELADAAVAVLLWGFPVEVALLVQAAPARLPLPPSRPAP